MRLRHAHLFVISAPSGGGKTTLCREVLKHFTTMIYSVSYTTRKPRKGESEGIDYYFIDAVQFKMGIRDGRWAEWAQVHGNFYGTSADFLDNGLKAGQDILLDLDVQGTRQILERYSETVAIFIKPPSMEVLQQRIKARGIDSPETISVRMRNAEKEMAQQHQYQHVIVNDQLSGAVSELISVIENYRMLPDSSG